MKYYVISTFLYISVCWVISSRQNRKLEATKIWLYRRMLICKLLIVSHCDSYQHMCCEWQISRTRNEEECFSFLENFYWFLILNINILFAFILLKTLPVAQYSDRDILNILLWNHIFVASSFLFPSLIMLKKTT